MQALLWHVQLGTHCATTSIGLFCRVVNIF
jgi:hypothetical protein